MITWTRGAPSSALRVKAGGDILALERFCEEAVL
jgi:hypothetical protein